MTSSRFSTLKAVAGEFGLEEVVGEFHDKLDNKDEVTTAESIFNAQQTVLSNIMLVSALLLGFIVTGTLLSIGLTGRDNFGITELIKFFNWSAFATCFAFVSLITSFLTSVSGAHRMTQQGPVVAARTLTEGSVVRHVISEGSLYMSMFFFLVSLYHYIWMVYSGPDICPTYRGSASFCARQGEDLYRASVPICQPLCSSKTPDRREACGPEAEDMDCLCGEVCGFPWEKMHNWSTHSPDAHRAGIRIYNYHFFGYRPLLEVDKPTREKIIARSASLMCNHEALEAEKEKCFRDGGTAECTDLFRAWQKSEECMDHAVEDTIQCAKVCSWSMGMPPREALDLTTMSTFIPLGAALICLTLGRIIIIIGRACAVCHRHHTKLKGAFSSYNTQRDDDEEEDSDSGSAR